MYSHGVLGPSTELMRQAPWHGYFLIASLVKLAFEKLTNWAPYSLGMGGYKSVAGLLMFGTYIALAGHLFEC